MTNEKIICSNLPGLIRLSPIETDRPNADAVNCPVQKSAHEPFSSYKGLMPNLGSPF